MEDMSCYVSFQQMYTINNLSFYISSLKLFMLYFNWLQEVVVSLFLNSILLHSHIIHLRLFSHFVRKRMNVAIIDWLSHMFEASQFISQNSINICLRPLPHCVQMSHIPFFTFHFLTKWEKVQERQCFLGHKNCLQ